jgi:hypothetical protein
MDGDPVGTGLSVNIRVYNDLVSDEFREWYERARDPTGINT